MLHNRSCHCGQIKFVVEGTFTEGLDCNCSFCRRRGGLLAFVTCDRFSLTSPEDGLSTYMFNRFFLRHHFCSICGIAPFSEGKGVAGRTMISVNLRCLPDLDLETLTVKPYDGRGHASVTPLAAA